MVIRWFVDHYLREKAESDLIASFINHAATRALSHELLHAKNK
jgi:hypothetical protein